MFSLNYGFSDCINEYIKLITSYSMFGIIAISMVCLGIIMIMNVNSNSNNLVLAMLFNAICLILTFYKFEFEIIDHLDSIFEQNIMHNICFYFVNTLIALFILTFWFSAKHIISSCKFTMIIMYILILFNLLFALYISYVVDADLFVSLGNIYPMIFLGNIAAVGSYIYMLILYFVERYSKYYSKKEHLLYK